MPIHHYVGRESSSDSGSQVSLHLLKEKMKSGMGYREKKKKKEGQVGSSLAPSHTVGERPDKRRIQKPGVSLYTLDDCQCQRDLYSPPSW